MAEVVVVGGGVGGMAAALRLRATGHHVVLCERRDELGGKVAEVRREGFAFGLGPSLLTWPQVFADLVATAGRSLDELIELVPVDPIMRYHFDDGSGFDAHTDIGTTAGQIEAMAPGEGDRWRSYLQWAERCWQASENSFFTGPMDGLRDLRRGTGSPRDVLAVDPIRALAGRGRRAFTDPRLRMYVGRYATYSGSDPWRAPAALGCIPYLEHRYGAWYVRGGMVRLRDALEKLLRDTGVEVRTGCGVRRVSQDAGKVRGVVLADGETLRADVVVCDVDADVVHDRLLRDPPRRRSRPRARRSSSALLVLAAVRGRTPALAHHNVFFSSDQRAEFTDIFTRSRPPREPTIYLGCSRVDDDGQAPDGDENWTLLINTPAGPTDAWPQSPQDYGEIVFDRLARFGLDPRPRMRFVEVETPAGIAERDGGGDGAFYGRASHGRLAPLRRPGNRGGLAGLYLVGGSTHPGGGLPLVVLSARIVADLVDKEMR